MTEGQYRAFLEEMVLYFRLREAPRADMYESLCRLEEFKRTSGPSWNAGMGRIGGERQFLKAFGETAFLRRRETRNRKPIHTTTRPSFTCGKFLISNGVSSANFFPRVSPATSPSFFLNWFG